MRDDGDEGKDEDSHHGASDLVALASRLRKALGPTGQPSSPEDLALAVAIASNIVNQTALPSLPALLRSAVLDAAAVALAWGYQAGGSRRLLNTAVESWTEALRIVPNDPELDQILNNQAQGLRFLYEELGRVTDLDASLAASAHALLLARRDSRQRAIYLNTRAGALIARYDRTGRAIDLNSSIAAAKEAVDLATASGDPNLPGYLGNLASALASRDGGTAGVADIDAAMAAVDEALSVTPPGHSTRPTLLRVRAKCFARRYRQTANDADLKAALLAISDAIDQTGDRSPGRAGMLELRAVLLLDTASETQGLEDFDRAIACMDEVLGLTADDSADFPARLVLAGECLRLRFGRGKDILDLERAAKCVEMALRLTYDNHPDRIDILVGHARLLTTRYNETHAEADLDAAVDDWERAIQLAGSDEHRLPRLLLNYANCVSSRHLRTGRDSDIGAGRDAYRKACEVGDPLAVVRAAQSWLNWAFVRGAWAEATDAGAAGLAAGDLLMRMQQLRLGKESSLVEVRGMAAGTAYAWAMQGKDRQAVIAAERGRALLQAEAKAIKTAMRDLGSAGYQDLVDDYARASLQLLELARPESSRPRLRSVEFRTPSTSQSDVDEAIAAIRLVDRRFLVRPSDDEVFAQVQVSAAKAPVSYLLAPGPGGLALTVTSDGSIRVDPLRGLEQPTLGRHRTAYVDAHNGYRSGLAPLSDWLDALARTTRWLWDAVGVTLVRIASELGSHHLVVVPMGSLGIYPIHSAWVEDASTQTGRHYLADDIDLSYLPSASSIPTTATSDEHEPVSILVVDEPWPVTGTPLRGAEREVQSVREWFPEQTTLLRHHRATRPRVLAAMAAKTVVHFACHGIAQGNRPLDSLLMMAFDEPVTVADILESRLDGTRLVVLSACETAFPGGNLLDEVIGFPASFLQAGAESAIGSLWSVDDLATMLLLVRFYELWRGEGLPLWEALGGAQRWVRGLSRENRAAALPLVDFEGSGGGGDYPYSHPHWWAGFGLTGG